MKIAVAGSSLIDINAHFGYAEYFLIFDVDAEEPRLVEKRSATGH